MKISEANKILITQFEELASRAGEVGKEYGDNEELIKLTDCMHKLYITLANANAFELELSSNTVSEYPC